jgi:hypothetical protein
MRKPTVEELGIDLESLDWRRSRSGEGAVDDTIEVAFVDAAAHQRASRRPGLGVRRARMGVLPGRGAQRRVRRRRRMTESGE